MLPPYIDVFIQPVRDSQPAKVLVVALLILSLMDVIFGVLKAMFVSHDFSSHKFREGLIRKLSNLGLMVLSDVIDAMLLGGLDFGFQPVFLAVGASLALMEIMSLLEIYAEMHPEISDTPWYQMLAHSKDSLPKAE